MLITLTTIFLLLVSFTINKFHCELLVAFKISFYHISLTSFDQVITKNDLQQKSLIGVTLLIFVIDNLEQNLLRQPMSFVVSKSLSALDMSKF